MRYDIKAEGKESKTVRHKEGYHVGPQTKNAGWSVESTKIDIPYKAATHIENICAAKPIFPVKGY